MERDALLAPMVGSVCGHPAGKVGAEPHRWRL